mmetsp:Transcript_14610/g.35720  ORF Transcript_14610/g.35720 Transcript_14610/m.35720 type:complete len:240 (-) Transcript_14610:1056-1775(-)
MRHLQAQRGGTDVPPPRRVARHGRLPPGQRPQVERVDVLQVLLGGEVLPAEDVHDAVVVHGRVEPALRRGHPARRHRPPRDVRGVAEVGDVHCRGRVRGGAPSVVPDAPTPHPHLRVAVDDSRVFVAAHREIAGDFRVGELEGVQVARQQLAHVEPKSALHHEPAEHVHDVVGGYHRGGARARQRERAPGGVRMLDHCGHVERPLRHLARHVDRRLLVVDLAPKLVLQPHGIHGIQMHI